MMRRAPSSLSERRTDEEAVVATFYLLLSFISASQVSGARASCCFHVLLVRSKEEPPMDQQFPDRFDQPRPSRHFLLNQWSPFAARRGEHEEGKAFTTYSWLQPQEEVSDSSQCRFEG